MERRFREKRLAKCWAFYTHTQQAGEEEDREALSHTFLFEIEQLAQQRRCIARIHVQIDANDIFGEVVHLFEAMHQADVFRLRGTLITTVDIEVAFEQVAVIQELVPARVIKK